ncbi:hypothetical protein B0A50_07561 [Salinomyces thailandicus]|uniref:Pre-mRNA-splicing factor n=1 Tax=Salinomyces thailandicus TaxID=706561 RepID=A0A4U0TMY9_9PEZI|nr:hypothetical protein B0A50_07561 [Salinomyces thailandica]
MSRPAVADLTGDHVVAQLARKHWLTKSKSKVLPEVVKELWDAVDKDTTPPFTLLLLEQLQALERYLWPGYSDNTSNHHVLLLVLLANTKRRENLPIWPLFEKKPETFPSFFRRVLQLSLDLSLALPLRTHILSFLVTAFQSLDSGLVRRECAPLVSIGIWQHLHSEQVREQCLAKSAQVQKAWRASVKKAESGDAAAVRFERSWLYTSVLAFLDLLYEPGTARQESLAYCEKYLELLCDLLSQLPTRRYVNTLLRDLHVLSAIKLSPLYQDGDDSALLREMQEMLEHYVYFPVDEHSGRQISRGEYEDETNKKIAHLQNVALKLHPEKLKILILANYGSLAQRGELLGHLKDLSDAELIELCGQLGLRTAYPEKSHIVQDRALFDEVLATTICPYTIFTDRIRTTSILPTEASLYDPSILRADDYDGTRPLAVPKMNLQYLSLGDFLHRAFTLYQAESLYGIRKHLEDTIQRLQPRQQPGQEVRFDGFSRMAIPIPKPAVIDVVPARVGETVPAEVRVEILLDVSRLQPGLRREWEGLRDGDVVFLLGVFAEKRGTNGVAFQGPAEKAGMGVLRCAEVVSVLDENGRVLRHDHDKKVDVNGTSRPRQRRLLLKLDAASYKADKERADAGKGDVYDSVNVVVRRRSRENNFKPVLESLKQLALSDTPLPSWLQDVFLGYGDPTSASYKRLPNRLTSVDYRDTFLDWQHLVESLPGKSIEPDPTVDASFPPPYVLEAVEVPATTAERPRKKRRREQAEPAEVTPETLKVSTYQPANLGPYPTDTPKTNLVRFTPAQIEAVTSGTQPGLTVVVGPPGTGKTDVVTQIISNIYHNHPAQRTLLIAHSNQALNQLFQKIMALDIDERHLLRLGHGEEDLATEASFSKAGRVERFLERGAALLGRVQGLADSLGAVGAHGASCETAEYFFQVFVKPRWLAFWAAVETDLDDLAGAFPFRAFFADVDEVLFPLGASKEVVLENLRGCERHMDKLFAELADIRPFEILRNQRDKSNYLLVKEARIIAMTTTHAAIRRQEIAGLGFRYENLVMEEAAQVTEAESFIPHVLQGTPQRLHRVVLVGDPLQNAPVIQSPALASHATLSQSLFARLLRLGVPPTTLNAQGRARPELAQLYRHRYPYLTNLPHTLTAPEFTRANAGFRHPIQFINVPDYKGQGETSPRPASFQNLGEAEYAVALFQYLRLLGYPAKTITLLTAYAGQAALIKEVLAHRCRGNPIFGLPGWTGTVDKYQGEQNDFVILSLVRTKSVGFLRDVRRLTVAVSRARLGLWVLGRREVLEGCLEVREGLGGLLEGKDGGGLEVVEGESWGGCERKVGDTEAKGRVIGGVEELGALVVEMVRGGWGERGGAAVDGEGSTVEELLDGEVDGEEQEEDTVV